jgi:hypothetical protein
MAMVDDDQFAIRTFGNEVIRDRFQACHLLQPDFVDTL